MAKTITINGKQLSVGDKAFFVYDDSRKNPTIGGGQEATIDKIGTKMVYLDGAFDPVYISNFSTKSNWECQWGSGQLYADKQHYEETLNIKRMRKEVEDKVRSASFDISLDQISRILAILEE